MRKLIIFTGLFLLLTGCATNDNGTGENLTIFGRLSQIVQLGSTEETIKFKEQTDEFFVTVRGEVLLNRPAHLDISVTEIETGKVRDDLTVSVYVCNSVDEEQYGIGPCGQYNGALYEHSLTTTFVDGNYLTEDFEWDRWGGWSTTVFIESIDSSTELNFGTEVYPVRPPSSNAFELINISLPFIVIGLFLLLVSRFKGKLIQPLAITSGD